MSFIKCVAGLGLLLGLVACGGGGGSAGTPLGSTTTGVNTNTTGTVQTTAAGTVAVTLVNGSGTSTNSISAIEIAQVKVVVTDSSGAFIPGLVVSFSEDGPGLLKFAPLAQTAMTNSAGLAVIELRALDQTKTGATSVVVTTVVSTQSISANKTLEITNAPTTSGVVVNPQTLASSINFISTIPADQSIVLQGSGGNGRTETGILNFRVVDKNNTPVKSALVDFVVNPSADVTLNIAQGTTDADGSVITSVSSKAVPTSVVVTATVNGTAISAQSDQLKVTTGVGVQEGFEILPTIYNLDGALSGDSTKVTARLVDINSNPVADGVPVVFVASGGKIGSSSAGGCNTVNGECTVDFVVQDPRPANGIVTISGSAKIGSSATLLRQINVHMSAAALGIYEPSAGVPAATLTTPQTVALTSCSTSTHQYMVANALGYSVPIGSTLTVTKDFATGLSATIGANSVLDVSSFGPSFFDVLLDTASTTNPVCNATGITLASSTVNMKLNAPKSGRQVTVPLLVTYPAGDLQLLQVGTANTSAAIAMGACGFETTEIVAIGSDGLTLPAGATFTVSTTESSAAVQVSTVMPNTSDPTPPTNSNNTLQTASSNTSRQSIWLRVQAPTAGTAPCKTTGTIVDKTFDVSVNVSIAGRINSKVVSVKYPGN